MSFTNTEICKQLDMFENECKKMHMMNNDQIPKVFESFVSTLLFPFCDTLVHELSSFFCKADIGSINSSKLVKCTSTQIFKIQARLLRLLSWFLSNCYPNNWPAHFIDTCWSFIMFSPERFSSDNSSKDELSDTDFCYLESDEEYKFRWSFFYFRESMLARGFVSIVSDLQYQAYNLEYKDKVDQSYNSIEEEKEDTSSNLDIAHLFAPPLKWKSKTFVVCQRILLGFLMNNSDADISFDRFLPLLKSIKADSIVIISSLLMILQATSISSSYIQQLQRLQFHQSEKTDSLLKHLGIKFDEKSNNFSEKSKKKKKISRKKRKRVRREEYFQNEASSSSDSLDTLDSSSETSSESYSPSSSFDEESLSSSSKVIHSNKKNKHHRILLKTLLSMLTCLSPINEDKLVEKGKQVIIGAYSLNKSKTTDSLIRAIHTYTCLQLSSDTNSSSSFNLYGLAAYGSKGSRRTGDILYLNDIPSMRHVRSLFMSLFSFSLQHNNAFSNTSEVQQPFTSNSEDNPSENTHFELLNLEYHSFHLDCTSRLCSGQAFELFSKKEVPIYISVLSDILGPSPQLFRLFQSILSATTPKSTENSKDEEGKKGNGQIFDTGGWLISLRNNADARLACVTSIQKLFGRAHFEDQKLNTLSTSSGSQSVRVAQVAKTLAGVALGDSFPRIRRCALIALMSLPVSYKGKHALLQLKAMDSAGPVRKTALQQLSALANTIEWAGLSHNTSLHSPEVLLKGNTKVDGKESNELKDEKEKKITKEEEDENKRRENGEVLFDGEWMKRLTTISLSLKNDNSSIKTSSTQFLILLTILRGDSTPSSFLKCFRTEEDFGVFEPVLRKIVWQVMEKEEEMGRVMKGILTALTKFSREENETSLEKQRESAFIEVPISTPLNTSTQPETTKFEENETSNKTKSD